MRSESSSGNPNAHATPPRLAESSSRSGAAGRLSRPQRSQLKFVGGGFVALFACLLAFGAIAEDVHEQEANALDALATPLLHGLSNPTIDAVMRTLTDLGSTMVIVPLLVAALALLIWRQHRREALFLAV